MSPLPTRALSIRQPWAWLIVNGHKDIENRDWRHSYRGPVLIHASLKLEGDAHQDLLEGRHPVTDLGLPDEVRLAYTHAVMGSAVHRGGIVGIAKITGCFDGHDSPWFVGAYGFELTDARPLPFMPVRGQLGFFGCEYGDRGQ